MTSRNLVSAIVVNYNGAAFIEQCLDSLSREKCVREIIVVDNGSVDGSVDWLKANRPEVILIESRENRGFGRGCNAGAQIAGGEFLLLLNCDAELRSGLDTALTHLARNPNTGVVGGRLANAQGRTEPSVGREQLPIRLILSWLGLSRWFRNCSLCSREFVNEDWYDAAHNSVAWVCGALMLIRRSDWESIEGMDPVFFLYMEDVDFCSRLRAVGRHIDYVPTFTAMHRKRGGAKTVNARALLATMDSYNLYLSKHHSRIVVRTTLAVIGAVFLFRALVIACGFWLNARSMSEARIHIRAADRALRLSAGYKFSWGPPI